MYEKNQSFGLTAREIEPEVQFLFPPCSIPVPAVGMVKVTREVSLASVFNHVLDLLRQHGSCSQIPR